MEAIDKQEKQLNKIKTQEIRKKEKYRLDDILLDYVMNGSPKGKDILEKFTKDEKEPINCNNLFFKTGNPTIKNFDVLKRFGTFYDLLTGLFNREISIKKQQKNKVR